MGIVAARSNAVDSLTEEGSELLKAAMIAQMFLGRTIDSQTLPRCRCVCLCPWAVLVVVSGIRVRDPWNESLDRCRSSAGRRRTRQSTWPSELDSACSAAIVQGSIENSTSCALTTAIKSIGRELYTLLDPRGDPIRSRKWKRKGQKKKSQGGSRQSIAAPVNALTLALLEAKLEKLQGNLICIRVQVRTVHD